MRPIFIVKLIDGNTDNIFEYDFKNGQFVGQNRSYKYEDIVYFIGIPTEIIKSVFDVKKSKKAEVEDVVFE